MPTNDQISALERLTKLRDSGALNDAEFEAQKADLLAGQNQGAPSLFRRLWLVVTLTCLLITFPVALIILATGNVYRKVDGGWRPIRRGPRLFYASILALWLAAIVGRAVMSPDSLKSAWDANAPAGTTAVAETSANGSAPPDTCNSSDAADMVKSAMEDSATSKLITTKVLDFGHALELYYDRKENIRYCGADAEMNTGAKKLSYKLYFGPSGTELVSIKEGEDAYGAAELKQFYEAKERASAQQQSTSAQKAQSSANGDKNTVETNAGKACVAPKFEKGSSYTAARSSLLKQGYSPSVPSVREDGSFCADSSNQAICEQLPEIADCSADGHCSMEFKGLADDHFKIVTLGDTFPDVTVQSVISECKAN
ncbi:MAG: hypothetical protein JWR21_830 [Herminiimonas sp.]|nr:hypothetical protein [Herminiimonas sp.]